MNNNQYHVLKNNSCIVLKKIPLLEYENFYALMINLLKKENTHCVSYYGFPWKDKIRFICCVADDNTGDIYVASHQQDKKMSESLPSLTKEFLAMHVYEREIYENFNIHFKGHPWLKPLRYAHDRIDKTKRMEEYPFFRIENEHLHEVGVGPIHAGIIEPGHFRFICNGEQVLNLEIQLGYQHRGIEKLLKDKKHILHQTILAENIAGDTTIGHALCFIGLIESLSQTMVSKHTCIERCVALELERIAMHVSSLGGMCVDIAYQLGGAVLGALRTHIINFLQLWCGNRFGRGLLRAGGTNYSLNQELIEQLNELLNDFEVRFKQMTNQLFSKPDVLARFEETGIVSNKQVCMMGAVGMVARSSGLNRDIRSSHPFSYFKEKEYHPEVFAKGDVLARAQLRSKEVIASVQYIRKLLEMHSSLGQRKIEKPKYDFNLNPQSFTISLTEGFRGEICHSIITDDKGEISHYKVKDSSFHNWIALATAVRNTGISEFPICNKSFDLSYCGHDL